MNTLLVFFALPIATIILSIVLEKILRCSFLTAATFFAIYLIVAFAVFDATFLIFVIVYTIIAFITALIAEIFFFNRCRRKECKCNDSDDDNNNEIELSNSQVREIANRVANILTNNCNCNNCSCNNNDVATINIRNTNGERTTWCCRRRQ